MEGDNGLEVEREGAEVRQRIDRRRVIVGGGDADEFVARARDKDDLGEVGRNRHHALDGQG